MREQRWLDMSKVIQSPVKHFSGTVTLAEPLNMVQVLAWERAMRGRRELPDPVYVSDVNALYLPALLVCVESWGLEKVPQLPTVDTFPFSPRLASAELFAWLVTEVTRVYAGEAEEDGEKNA